MYVLDEPSIGLHQRDNERLIGTLQAPARPRQHACSWSSTTRTRSAPPTTSSTWARAPACTAAQRGRRGHAGRDRAPTRDSLTGQLPRPAPSASTSPASAAAPDAEAALAARASAPRGNNLKDVDARIPARPVHLRHRRVRLRQIDAGQRHPVRRAGARAVRRHERARPRTTASKGIEHFDKVIDVDQTPIGRTPRSNPATYTGLFTPIRELFAEVPAARERGYGAGPLQLQRRRAAAAKPARATA
jgi:excinuclease ABC subunit A